MDPSLSKNVCRLSDLLQHDVELSSHATGVPECYNLLQAMELEDFEVENTGEDTFEDADQEEMMALPVDWVYSLNQETYFMTEDHVADKNEVVQDEKIEGSEKEVLIGDDQMKDTK